MDTIGGQSGKIGGKQCRGGGDDEAVKHTPGNVDGCIRPGVFQVNQEMPLGNHGKAGLKIGVGPGGVDNQQVKEEQAKNGYDDQAEIRQNPTEQQSQSALGVL